MPLPDHIAAQVAKLDAAAQTIVELVWHMHEEQMAELASLRAQNDKYRQMLFGSRSEKLPTIQSEVRRVVEAEEFTPEALGLDETATDDEVAAARTKQRRKRGRASSEVARKRRKADLSKLPVLREEVSVRDEDLPEGMTRDDFGVVGTGTVVQRIEHVREHLVVTEYVLETLSDGSGDHIIKAEAPPSVMLNDA